MDMELDARNRKVLENPILSNTSDAARTLGEMLSDSVRSADVPGETTHLWALVNQLGYRQRIVLRRRFIDEWSQSDRRNELGITQVQVSKLLDS